MKIGLTSYGVTPLNFNGVTTNQRRVGYHRTSRTIGDTFSFDDNDARTKGQKRTAAIKKKLAILQTQANDTLRFAEKLKREGRKFLNDADTLPLLIESDNGYCIETLDESKKDGKIEESYYVTPDGRLKQYVSITKNAEGIITQRQIFDFNDDEELAKYKEYVKKEFRTDIIKEFAYMDGKITSIMVSDGENVRKTRVSLDTKFEFVDERLCAVTESANSKEPLNSASDKNYGKAVYKATGRGQLICTSNDLF